MKWFKYIAFLCCLIFISSASASELDFTCVNNYYVDTNCANDGDGTAYTCAGAPAGVGAWNDLKTVFESVAYVAGDCIWIRRTSSYDEGVENNNADIAYTENSGTEALPIAFIGWPRASVSINCDWVNGSTTVDNVDSNDMDREKHSVRFVTGPDGFDYLITKIVDTNTFLIEREYAGTTLANQNVTIKADDDYAGRPAAPKATWDSDPHDLVRIDFNDESYQFKMTGSGATTVLKFLEFRESDDSSGVISENAYPANYFEGCIFYNDNNRKIVDLYYGDDYLEQCLIEGNGVGTSQKGIWARVYGDVGTTISIKDSVIRNCGDYGIAANAGLFELENVNIGVEDNNGDDSVAIFYAGFNPIIFRDCKIDGTNGAIYITSNNNANAVRVQEQNRNHTLGEHRTTWTSGYAELEAITDIIPNKKISDNVIEWVGTTVNANRHGAARSKISLYKYQVTQSTGSQNYKIWIYNDTGNALNDTAPKATEDICMVCRYVAGYDDTSEYVWKEVWSDEIDIADAATADDWDYLQCDNINPAVSSPVICEVFVSRYNAGDTGNIYVDPSMQHP